MGNKKKAEKYTEKIKNDKIAQTSQSSDYYSMKNVFNLICYGICHDPFLFAPV